VLASRAALAIWPGVYTVIMSDSSALLHVIEKELPHDRTEGPTSQWLAVAKNLLCFDMFTWTF
jgi:hypothetical protein